MKTKITFEYNEDEKNTSIQKIRAEDAWDALAQIESTLSKLDTLGSSKDKVIADIKRILEECNLDPLDIP